MTPAILCSCYDPDDCEYNPEGYDPTVPAGETYNPEDTIPARLNPRVRPRQDRGARHQDPEWHIRQGLHLTPQAGAAHPKSLPGKGDRLHAHRDHGMFPEMKAEYHDFLWQCLKQAATSI